MRPRLFAVLLLCAFAAAQQQRMEMHEQRTSDQKKPEHTATKAEMKIARGILDTAEAESAAFEPADRSFLCYQAALGQKKLDRASARDMLLRCLTASQSIEGKDHLKHQIQGWIVKELAQYGPETGEQVLPEVEGDARATIRSQLITDYSKSKNFDRAIELTQNIDSANERFPYGAVAELMTKLPEERRGDRTTLFSTALADYKSRKPDANTISSEDMGTFVVRFAGDVPQNLALEAIDELLKHAQPEGKVVPAQLVISNGDKMAAFHSIYEFRLFQVMPALKKLDPERAESLLRDNQMTKALMSQYADGMKDINPGLTDGPPPENSTNHMSMSFTNGGDTGTNRAGEEANRIAYRKQVEAIVKGAESNPKQAIAQALSLPNSDMGYRSQALDGIANALLKKNPQQAKAAIDEQLKSLDDLHYLQQESFLRSAIRQLLELDDKETAEKAVGQGLKYASKLYKSDTSADDPNMALKPFWPSAAMWRAFVAAAVKLSPQKAVEAAKEIDDPEINLFTRIWLANSLLDVPRGLVMTQVERKSGENDTNITD